MEKIIKLFMATAAGLEQAYIVYEMMQTTPQTPEPKQRRQIGFYRPTSASPVAKKSNSVEL